MIEIKDIGFWDTTKNENNQSQEVMEYIYSVISEREFDMEEVELCGYNSDGPVNRFLKRIWNDDGFKIVIERKYLYEASNPKAFQISYEKINVEQ
jgi:hypothetical protein